MVSHGIGVDIVETARISALIASGDRFLEHHFDPTEIAYCRSKAHPHLHFAGRFAAKEAVFKSLGLDSRHWFAWREIAIHPREAGAPVAVLSGSVESKVRDLSISHVEVSISHSEHYAVAMAIAWKA